MIDVIILSNAKDEYLHLMTQVAIDTCIESEGEKMFKIIVLEQNPNVTYNNTWKIYHPEIPFNYNQFMNMGAMLGESEYIAFCNNDLVFEKNWASNLIKAMEEHSLDSASPLCKTARFQRGFSPNGRVVIGNRTSVEFSGWCFVLNRKAWEKIGGLDEDFSFWCADNATLEQLKNHNLRHGLVTNSIVQHLEESTLKTIPKDEKEQMTFCQVLKFNKKYDKDVWGMGKGE